jgi:hypothetical protein
MMLRRKFVPNPVRRAEFKVLLDYVSKLQAGARISWVEITQATGVAMTKSGQDLLRFALKRAKRPYLAIQGEGVELSSKDNALEVVASKTRRFVGALDNARETTSLVSTRHLDELPQEAKNRLLHQQAIFDTLSLSANLAKKLPAK